jgi:putative ABC transport system permease protein
MSLAQSFLVALRALSVNRLRSGLTMLGIIIGISTVITLLSVGQGVQAAVNKQMQNIGSNLIFVIPGKMKSNNTSMRSSFLKSVSISTLTYGDMLAISDRANVPDLIAVAPEFVASATVNYASTTIQTSVAGVTAAYSSVRDSRPKLGTFISDDDFRARSLVAVIGQKVASDLFPAGVNPLGQTIKVNRVPFKVIGVMNDKGQSAFADDNDVVLIPLSTAQSRVFQGRNTEGDYTVSVIYGKAVGASRLEAARDEITRLLRRRHRLLYSSDENDFTVLTQKDVGSVLESLTELLTAFLGLIALVSLLVGGIGIMNIMLVSVTERTREIGLRKAIGARQSDILTQFLVEAIILSLVGGLIGILIGVLATVAASLAVPDIKMHLSVGTILLSTGFATAIGLFFGMYPASRAARLNPIDALRYE